MLTSLNQMLSRMDTLVPDRRCLRASDGQHAGLESDTSRVSILMPKSDLSFAYELSLKPKAWDYKIQCDDGMHRTNRFFACLLFEPIKVKVMHEARFRGKSNVFRMQGVHTDELSGLISIAFAKQEVHIRRCDLQRCAEIANQFDFWRPVTNFLWRRLHAGLQNELQQICHEMRDAECDLTKQHWAEMLAVTPTQPLPKRFSYSETPLTRVEQGSYYGKRVYEVFFKPVVSAETTATAAAHVLPWPDLDLHAVPMTDLRAIVSFDHVKTQVGYPAFDRIYEGAPLNTVHSAERPQCVGRFYLYHNSDTHRRMNADDGEKRIVFLLGFTSSGERAYVLYHLGVTSVHSHELCTITNGAGGDDAAARARADLILNALPPPSRHDFGEAVCQHIDELTPGAYYHCLSDLLYEQDRMDGVRDDDSYRRRPVLYVGPAPEGKAYIFGNQREVAVDIRYLHPLENDPMDPHVEWGSGLTDREHSPEGERRNHRW